MAGHTETLVEPDRLPHLLAAHTTMSTVHTASVVCPLWSVQLVGDREVDSLDTVWWEHGCGVSAVTVSATPKQKPK